AMVAGIRGIGSGLLLLVFAACGGAARGDLERTGPATGMTPAEIEALYEARTDSARMRFTEADVEFATGMIVHHAQAPAMASLAAERGAGQSIRTVAARITNAQKDEIATMERWLRDRRIDPPDVRVEGTSVVVAGGDRHHVHDMPGMISADEMDRLAAA